MRAAGTSDRGWNIGWSHKLLEAWLPEQHPIFELDDEQEMGSSAGSD